jgi:hypothetical protein
MHRIFTKRFMPFLCIPGSTPGIYGSYNHFPGSAHLIFTAIDYDFPLYMLIVKTIKINIMKGRILTFLAGALVITGILCPESGFGQNQKEIIKRFPACLPSGKPENILRKYRMTAVYINRDLYGNFMNKSSVTGDFTRGYEDGHMQWNNVYISHSGNLAAPFPEGTNQKYMEDFRYNSSDNMLDENAFRNFPSTPDNVLARNLVWDMMTFEKFGWDYCDSLKLNVPFEIVKINGEFDMAEIGKYDHNKIILCWKGFSVIDNELCAVIDFNAIDNIVELDMDMIKSKGTEQYWGTVWLSMKTKNIEKAYMYSGTMQEMELAGMQNKLLAKTIRELWVEPIE